MSDALPAVEFVPSPFQADFFDWVERGSGSVILVAGPGSGKSTTILRSLPLIPEHKSVHVFAFNSDVAREMNSKIDLLRIEKGRDFRNVRASTFHSVGLGAVAKRLGKKPREVETNRNKLKNICRDWLGESDRELYGDFVCKLVGFAKGQGVGALVPDTADVWFEMIAHHDMFLESEEADEERAVELARKLLAISNERAKLGEIDFDDQLYLVVLWKLRLWQNDIVYVEGAQDTNPVRRAIAKLALRFGGRLAAVGDPRQGIYGFTGASADALDLIKREFAAVEMPLTVCYRCSAAVVASVDEVYPGCIQAAPNARPGVPTATLALEEALKVLGPTDAILCRNVAPLVDLAYDLIARKRGCRIAGRDIGENLVKLVEKMRARTIEGLLEKLEAFREREVAKFTAKGEEAKAEGVSDRVACLTTIISHLDENSRTIPSLVREISSMFSDEGRGGLLTLSTLHKSKGKEWPRVAIFRPDLMPSKWARQEHQVIQERNLDWVARSRAMEQLMFVPKPDEKKKTRLVEKGKTSAVVVADDVPGPDSDEHIAERRQEETQI